MDGEVVEANGSLAASPEVINQDPYGAGWLIKIKYTALPELLTAAEYAQLTGE
jgi:glycine cleavage system H protein